MRREFISETRLMRRISKKHQKNLVFARCRSPLCHQQGRISCLSLTGTFTTMKNCHVIRNLFFLSCLMTVTALLTACAAKQGRIAVILDNSGSMSVSGTAFSEIKESVFDALRLIPFSYEKGLRVFDTGGSFLISPYRQDLSELYSRLKPIEPGGNTYIGKSLSDAADDLLEVPDGDNRLIFITDGEGNISDIRTAEAVRERLDRLKGEFRCSFILFSKRKNVPEETPVGKISEILGCDLTVPDDYASAGTLTPALQRILGFDFYPIGIIISAVLYLILLVFSAHLVFAVQCARGLLPRYARMRAILFLVALVPPIAAAHLAGIFSWMSAWTVWYLILAGAVVFLAALGSEKKPGKKRSESDPFA